MNSTVNASQILFAQIVKAIAIVLDDMKAIKYEVRRDISMSSNELLNEPITATELERLLGIKHGAVCYTSNAH